MHYYLRMFAPCCDYGVIKWATKSLAYARSRCRKLNKKERECGFLMRFEVVAKNINGLYYSV